MTSPAAGNITPDDHTAHREEAISRSFPIRFLSLFTAHRARRPSQSKTEAGVGGPSHPGLRLFYILWGPIPGALGGSRNSQTPPATRIVTTQPPEALGNMGRSAWRSETCSWRDCPSNAIHEKHAFPNGGPHSMRTSSTKARKSHTHRSTDCGSNRPREVAL